MTYIIDSTKKSHKKIENSVKPGMFEYQLT